MKFETKVSIPRPRRTVWKALMDVASWRTWYTRDLSKVVPRWEESAQMVWAEGEPSVITTYAPAETLAFGACWFTLADLSEGVTMLAYGETESRSLPATEHLARAGPVQSVALQFKDYVLRRGIRFSLKGLLGRGTHERE